MPGLRIAGKSLEVTDPVLRKWRWNSAITDEEILVSFTAGWGEAGKSGTGWEAPRQDWGAVAVWWAVEGEQQQQRFPIWRECLGLSILVPLSHNRCYEPNSPFTWLPQVQEQACKHFWVAQGSISFPNRVFFFLLEALFSWLDSRFKWGINLEE